MVFKSFMKLKTEDMPKIKLYPLPFSLVTPALVTRLHPFLCETQTHTFLISAHGLLEIKPDGSLVQQVIHDGTTTSQQQQFLVDSSTITDGSVVYQVDPEHHLERLKRSVYTLSSTCHIIIETPELGSFNPNSRLYLEMDDTTWPTFLTSPLYSTFLSLVK